MQPVPAKIGATRRRFFLRLPSSTRNSARTVNDPTRLSTGLSIFNNLIVAIRML